MELFLYFLRTNSIIGRILQSLRLTGSRMIFFKIDKDFSRVCTSLDKILSHYKHNDTNNIYDEIKRFLFYQ